MNATDKTLGDAMSSNAALSTAVGGRIFNTRAAEGTVEDYIRFFSIIEIPEYYLDGHYVEDIPYQIDCYSTNPSQAGVIADLVKSALDNKTLTVAGLGFISCRRESCQRQDEYDLNRDIEVYRYMLHYRVRVEKSL